MNCMKKNQLLLVFLIVITIVSSCGTTIKQSKGQTFYLAHTIWYENEKKLSITSSPYYSMTIAAINYKTGRIVPAGKEVKNITVFGGKIKFLIPSPLLFST